MISLRKFFKVVGPGVVTGAADDDPSGIATYSQVGARFGYGQLWAAIFMFPLQVAVQEACARIGAVTGKGLAAVVRDNYSRKALYAIVGLLLIANTINIGADIGAMAAAAELIVPLDFAFLAIGFAVIILVLELVTSYKVYANILKWLCLALFAYPLTLFVINAPWATIVQATFTPHLEFSFEFLFLATGVLGTTISPYMFFWEASEEVEEERAHDLIGWDKKPRIGRFFLNNLRLDNFTGMLLSEVGTWSIMVVTATVLHAQGVTNIQTAAQAAEALQPLVATFPNAGFLAKIMFATGIIGLGLLAVPVLSGSVSYALSETFFWREGLDLKFRQARGFYGVIIVATLVGLLMNFIGIDPIDALIYTAVINGVVAAPLILMIGIIASSERIMGKFKSGALSKIFVWLTFLGMATAAALMIVMAVK